MRASLVCASTGRTVCTIDSASQAAGGLLLGRQAQFDIRDAACSRQQARLEFLCGSDATVPALTVTCVGAGRLSVECVEARGRPQRVLPVGESTTLSDGDSLILGEACRLVVRLLDDDLSRSPAVKRPRLQVPVADEADSDDSASEVNRQLAVMRETAARLAKKSPDTNQSGLFKVANQLESSDAVAQSESSKAVNQLESSNATNQSKSSNAADQSKSSEADNESESFNATSQAVAPKASKCTSQSEATLPGWRDFSSALVYTTAGCRPSAKIAGFDMDGTLITTQSGRVFPKDIGDWKVIYSQVPGRLKSLVAEGCKVVLFSNQKGVEAGKVKVDELKIKIERVAARLGAPLQAFLSVRGHRHRKPCSGMWRLLARPEFNGGLLPDPNQSFYVGDAAGRPAETGKGRGGRKADFSCSDRLFALNCHLSAFYTPEEFFLGHRPVPLAQCRLPEFNPTAYASADPRLASQQAVDAWPSEELRQLLLPPGTSQAAPLLALLVGYPASGKSTLCRQLASLLRRQSHRTISVVSRDQLGTWQRCVQSAETALRATADPIVLVDNTNIDADSRQRYVELARRISGSRIVCLPMQCSLAQCLHNERFRRILEEEAEAEAPGAGRKRREPVGEMVFNQMRAKFSEPQLMEGFASIVRVPFVPRFERPEHFRLYCEYLMEK